MSDIAIKVENVSKLYRLGEIGTGTIRNDLQRWWANLNDKEDPFVKIGQQNDRTKKTENNYVWALKDIDFEVKKGEVLGIIGRNGAGKSTLLKILSKITSPSKGQIKINGRIASLLEVGTGFHPELSGRDNIFMNGAVLGMKKWEIQQRFDEIVDFSGVEAYIDTPVKRYSSGMYVRLAFAVAAFLEPEILIVDEVLAVGDAEFQKKCIGRMKDVSINDGRTVIFVSHSLPAVNNLCTQALIMKNGSIFFNGSAKNAIDIYTKEGNVQNTAHFINEKEQLESDILEIKVLNTEGAVCTSFHFNEQIQVVFILNVSINYLHASLGFRVKDQYERNVFTSEIKLSDYISQPGVAYLKVSIPASFLVPNHYELIVGFHVVNSQIISYLESPVSFDIEETGSIFSQYAGNDYGCVFVDCKWSVC